MPRIRPTLVDLGAGPVPRAVRDPRDGRPLPPAGRDIAAPLAAYWHRRLRDGDVEIVSAAPPSDSQS